MKHFSEKMFFILISIDKPYQGSSLSEAKSNKLLETDIYKTIAFSNRFLIKTYPAGSRVDSSNYDPTNYWNCGFQMGNFIE